MGEPPSIPTLVATGTWDSMLRLVYYLREVQASSQRSLHALNANPNLTPHQLLQLQAQVVQRRNEILDTMRSWITPFGRAFSRALKEEGLTHQRIVARYTLRVLQDAGTLQGLLQQFALTIGGANPDQTIDDRCTGVLHILGRYNNGVIGPPMLGAPPVGVAINMMVGPFANQATAIAAAFAGFDEDEFITFCDTVRNWMAAHGGAHDFALFQDGQLLLLALMFSRDVTRRIVLASGRTNGTVNAIARFYSFAGCTVLVAGGIILAVYARGMTIPPTITTMFSLPFFSLPSATRAIVQTATSLGSGYIVTRMQGSDCTACCYRDRGTGGRIGFVFVAYFLPLFIIMAIYELLIGPALFPDD